LHKYAKITKAQWAASELIFFEAAAVFAAAALPVAVAAGLNCF
jgi:hypothetical protein